MQIYIRYLVEEGESLWCTDEVRKWKRRLPRLSKQFCQCFGLDKTEWTQLPYRESEQEDYTSLPLCWIWPHKWQAPMYYFACPICSRRVRRLIRLNDEDLWACRHCHKSKYVSQVLRLGMDRLTLERLESLVYDIYYSYWARPGPRPKRARQMERTLERIEALMGNALLPKAILKWL